ncbi:zinc finger domain-containing protein [Streptomyces sparsus]
MPYDNLWNDSTSRATPARQALWSLSSSEVSTIACPTCGAAKRAPCRTLWDRPVTALHRGRTTRYLNIRFGLGFTEPHIRSSQTRTAPTISGTGLRATRVPHPQPWRLPMHELSDLVNVSFLDLAKVVTAHACGLQRSGLDELLFGPDRIQQSIDALVYATYDRQIQREIRVLADGPDKATDALAAQQQALQHQLRAAKRSLKDQRIAELTTAGVLPFPAATDDPRHLARAWLGRYLSSEKEALVRDTAVTAGVPASATVHIRTIEGKITRSIDNGWLAAPLDDTVHEVIQLDDPAFHRRLIADASRQDGRDDALCHPLVLNRWRDQLNEAITQIAPSAENPTTKGLHDLTSDRRRRGTAQLEQLSSRRRLFAVLLQRKDECIRLITALNDALSLAEHRDPSHAKLKQAADQAYDELVRRHPNLYQHIQAFIAPHTTRYGRLRIQGSRSHLQRQLFDELDRMHSRQLMGTPAER